MKKTAGKVLFLFILAFSLAGCSEDTTTYYHSAADLRESAKDGFVLPGDSNAQYFLGLKYYEGEEVPQNYSKATYWFQKAAGQGHRYALFKLGEMCENGEGGPKDYRKAAQWFSLAAEHGYGSLAMQHYKRILKLADSAEEFQSLEKKATAGYIFDGDAEAQLKLGLRYRQAVSADPITIYPRYPPKGSPGRQIRPIPANSKPQNGAIRPIPLYCQAMGNSR